MTTALPVRDFVARDGYAFVAAPDVLELLQIEADPEVFRARWDDLEPDNYLEGDYIFRHRRYGQVGLVPSGGPLRLQPQKPYVQSPEINSYVGGVERRFAHLPEDLLTDPIFVALLRSSFDMFDIPEQYRDREWLAEVHMFRLSARSTEPTHPTPEGIHRDGVPFGALHLMGKQGIQGGVSHVYDMDKRLLGVATLREPFDTFYCYDNRVMHYATPLFSEQPEAGHRDVLVYGFHLPDTEYERVV